MKSNFLLFLILTLCQMALFSQTIEFAPEGSVWKYQRQEGGQGPPVLDIVEVRYVDNVWVDSILCKRMVAPEGDYYVYQVGDRVYHRRDTASQFKLLWDFGVMPGDSFSIYPYNVNIPNQEFKVVCTGRDTIWENNIPLPRIDLTVFCYQSPYPVTVNPRYGSMYNGHCGDYLFNSYNYCVIDAGYGFRLLNYSDNTFPTVVQCIAYSSTNEFNAQQVIRTAPNPTSGIIQLINLPEEADVYCYDMFGRLVGIPQRSGNTIDLSVYPVGIYVLEVRLDRWVTRKLKVSKI